MANDLKYCYPGTNILINIPGIKKQEQLNKFERIATANRIMQLEDKPIAGKFDLKHLQEIHKYIFQDVYPFAGQIREVDIAKQNTLFCKSQFIPDMAKDIFQSLRKEKLLLNLNIDQFSERAAHYMAEINMLHPFREGNGRTQREFIRTLALNAGYDLDWSRVSSETILNASVRSVYETDNLGKVIKDCIVNQEPEQSLSRFYRNLGQELER